MSRVHEENEQHQFPAPSVESPERPKSQSPDRGFYTKIGDEFLRSKTFTADQKFLFILLKCHVKKGKRMGLAFPSLPYLQARTKWGRGKTLRVLRSLSHLGLIDITSGKSKKIGKRNSVNQYVVHDEVQYSSSPRGSRGLVQLDEKALSITEQEVQDMSTNTIQSTDGRNEIEEAIDTAMDTIKFLHEHHDHRLTLKPSDLMKIIGRTRPDEIRNITETVGLHLGFRQVTFAEVVTRALLLMFAADRVHPIRNQAAWFSTALWGSKTSIPFVQFKVVTEERLRVSDFQCLTNLNRWHLKLLCPRKKSLQSSTGSIDSTLC